MFFSHHGESIQLAATAFRFRCGLEHRRTTQPLITQPLPRITISIISIVNHRQPSSTIVNHASSNIVTHRQPSSSIVIHRQPSSAIVIHRQPSSPSSTIVINRRPSSTIAIHRYPSTIVIHRSSSIVIHRHYTLVARFPLPFLSPALLYLYQGGYTQRHAFSSARRPEKQISVSA